MAEHNEPIRLVLEDNFTDAARRARWALLHLDEAMRSRDKEQGEA